MRSLNATSRPPLALWPASHHISKWTSKTSWRELSHINQEQLRVGRGHESGDALKGLERGAFCAFGVASRSFVGSESRVHLEAPGGVVRAFRLSRHLRMGPTDGHAAGAPARAA